MATGSALSALIVVLLLRGALLVGVILVIRGIIRWARKVSRCAQELERLNATAKNIEQLLIQAVREDSKHPD